MRILGIAGSVRRGSHNRRLIRAAQEVGKPALVYGHASPRVANTTCIAMPGATSGRGVRNWL